MNKLRIQLSDSKGNVQRLKGFILVKFPFIERSLDELGHLVPRLLLRAPGETLEIVQHAR